MGHSGWEDGPGQRRRRDTDRQAAHWAGGALTHSRLPTGLWRPEQNAACSAVLVLFAEASLCPSDKDKHMCNVLKTDSMAKHFAVGRGHSTHFTDEETEAQRD